MEFSHIDSSSQPQKRHTLTCSQPQKRIPPRRASLRSSKRHTLTCSKPQKKSREQHSSPTDEKHKMRREESEKAENSVAQVAIAEMIEDEVGEIEKEPLTEGISNVGCSSPSLSFSLKLTEIVNMMDGEDDDEVDSVTPADAVDGYQVKPEYIPILKRLLSKYGDITRNCSILTTEVRSSVMDVICGIISELQEIDLYKINEGFLLRKITLVNEIKNIKVEIEWLHYILDEMLEARKLLEQCVTLKECRESKKIAVENAQSKLDECEEQIKEMAVKFRSLSDEQMVCKETLKKANDNSTRIEETIKDALSKVKRFVKGSLVDDLI